MIGYDSNKAVSFKATDKKLLKTYRIIWKKISGQMKNKTESASVWWWIHKDKNKIIWRYNKYKFSS